MLHAMPRPALHHMLPRLAAVLCMVACLLCLSACHDEEQMWPSYVQDLACLQADADGRGTTLVLDNGTRYGVNNPPSSMEAHEARRVCTYYLLQAINDAHNAKNTELFNARRDAYLQLILDLDELLNTNKDFIVGRWTQLARGIADEVNGKTIDGTPINITDADRDWLELNNARTLITTWGDRGQANDGGLRD